MYEKLLTETERFLVRRKEPLAPIKTLWQSVHREGLRQGFAVPSLVDFSCLLDGDKRFEVVPPLSEVILSPDSLAAHSPRRQRAIVPKCTGGVP